MKKIYIRGIVNGINDFGTIEERLEISLLALLRNALKVKIEKAVQRTAIKEASLLANRRSTTIKRAIQPTGWIKLTYGIKFNSWRDLLSITKEYLLSFYFY